MASGMARRIDPTREAGMNDTSEKVRENRLRRKADRMGLHVVKSRRRDPDALDYGLYMIADNETGGTIHPNYIGQPFALDLDEVEACLEEWERE